MTIKFKQLREKYKIRATTKDGEKFTSKDYKTKKDAVDAMYDLKHFTKSGQKGRFKSIDLVKEGDVPKDHEYGPSSRKRPAGKRGYTSSDSARTTHLKTIKKWSKKKRRQGDKEFANEANWSISPEKQKEVNKFLAKSTGGSMHQDVNLVMKKFGLSKSKAQDMVFNWMSSWSPDKRLSAWGPKDMPEESPANATGTAVAGTGDDSSTVLVKKRKELQKRLMRRFSIKETLDKILPDPVEKEDELTTRKNQLKELAKNRNV